MKKKDLVPGEIYASKRGAPRLLINAHTWSKQWSAGNKDTRWWLMRKGARPHQSYGYGSSAAGVLTVQVGSLKRDENDLQEWAQEHAKRWVERLSSIEPGDRGTGAHTDVVEELHQELIDCKFYLTVENYTTWAGPWKQVSRELEERSRGIQESYARLNALQDARNQRIEAIKVELTKRYGVEPIGTGRVTVHGDYGTTSSVPNGLTLNLADLELILNLQEEK